MSEGDNSKLFAKLFSAAQRPEGLRFYRSEGTGANEDQAINSAVIGLEHKLLTAPSDSITTAQAKSAMGDDWSRIIELLKNNPSYTNDTIY